MRDDVCENCSHPRKNHKDDIETCETIIKDDKGVVKRCGCKRFIHWEESKEKTSAHDHQVGGDHYKHFPIQPAYYNIVNGIPWAEGEAIKYLSRWRDKGGVRDIEKARHICDMLVEFHSGRLDYEKLIEEIKAVEAEGEDVEKTETAYGSDGLPLPPRNRGLRG